MGQPNILIADAAGLNTQPNELTLQSGALVVAKNVEITRDGVIEVARGFEDFSGNLPDFRPEQLFVSDRVAYAHVDGGWWYFDETTERWLRKRGALGGKTSYPFRIVYTTGHLYLTYQNFIADLDLATGRMSVLAGIVTAHATTDGTGIAARFWVPAGMAIVGGNLYVCDELNHTIRKVVIATGVVTTIAGTAGVSGVTDATGTSASFNQPTGMVSDGTNLYVCDTENHTIRKIVIATGVVTTLAGTAASSGTTDATGTSAKFKQPAALTIDGDGLYVCDTGNHTIRKVVIATGVVTTIAGTATVTGTTDATGTAAKFNQPYDIISDGTNLYVCDLFNDTIRQIVIASAVVTTIAGTAGVSGFVDGIGTAAKFYRPYGIVSDGVSMYVADQANQAVRKMYPNGYVATISAAGGYAGTTMPRLADGVLVGPDE